MPVLKYHTGSGNYADLPGNIEEVTISANQPPVNTDLWIDTDDDTGYIPSSRLGSRNVIRNGDMGITQRGGGPWTLVDWQALYGIDGWRALKVGGSGTYSRYVPPVDTGSPLLMVVTSGQSLASQFTNIESMVEDVSFFSNRLMTLSFDAVSGGGTPKIGIEYQQSFGTGGSTGVAFPIQAVPITTTRTRYSITFRTASLAGKTIGSGSYFSLTFWLSAGSDYAARASSIGIQNSTISIGDVQLEEGASATPFERLPIQQQLAWCQRYFQRWTQPPLRGVFYSTTQPGRLAMSIPPMRVAPTRSTGGNYFDIYDGANTTTTTSVNMTYATTFSVEVDFICNGLAGATWRPACAFIGGAGTGYIDLSAEL